MPLQRCGAAAVAAVVLALIAGCEHDVMRPPVIVSSVAFLPLLTPAQARGLVSVPWDLQAPPAAGESLFLQVPAVACPRLRGVAVAETPAEVTIQVFATLGRCTGATPGYVVAPVRLAGPLGTRHLVHGPVAPAGAVIGTAPPARRR